MSFQSLPNVYYFYGSHIRGKGVDHTVNYTLFDSFINSGGGGLKRLHRKIFNLGFFALHNFVGIGQGRAIVTGVAICTVSSLSSDPDTNGSVYAE